MRRLRATPPAGRPPQFDVRPFGRPIRLKVLNARSGARDDESSAAAGTFRPGLALKSAVQHGGGTGFSQTAGCKGTSAKEREQPLRQRRTWIASRFGATTKALRLVSVLAACVLFTRPVFATPAPPGATPSLAPEAPVEITPIHYAAHGNGPIVVNWHFKHEAGFVNLTVSLESTYRFSGNYKRKEPGKIFHVELALKSRVGAVYLFRYVGDASNAVQWSEKGKSTILKDDFKYFAPGQRVHWRPATQPTSGRSRASPRLSDAHSAYGIMPVMSGDSCTTWAGVARRRSAARYNEMKRRSRTGSGTAGRI